MNSNRYEQLMDAKMEALSGNYGIAMSVVDRLMAENIDDHEVLRFKANLIELAVLSQNKPVSAIERQRDLQIAQCCYEKILTDNPEDTLTLKDLADHHKNFGKIEDANTLYHQVISLLRKRAAMGEDLEDEIKEVICEIHLLAS